MVWFEVTGFGVAVLLTGTWSTLLVSVSLGNVARHLRPRSSISTSSNLKILRGSSSLSCIASSVPLVVFGSPKTVVVVVVIVVTVVVVGTVLLPVVTVLPG